MPAQHEEQEYALADKVIFKELLSPETWKDGVLTCEVMSLGDYDASGRRSVKSAGKKQELHFDTVIGAVGAGIDTEPFARNNILLSGDAPVTGAGLESSIPDVYIAGDCRKGSGTVVKAIADGKIAAADILRKTGLNSDFSEESAPVDFTGLYLKKGIISPAREDSAEGDRCLSCNTLCELCADVCPNRANVVIEMNGHQIVHIDRLCNECGNCAVFCPHSGKPYTDKLTLFSCEEDFTESENSGFLRTGAGTWKIRLEDKSVAEYRKGGKTIPRQWADLLETILLHYEYLLPGGET
jgi:putative selenate reductase